jgi:hypothetical protein
MLDRGTEMMRAIYHSGVGGFPVLLSTLEDGSTLLIKCQSGSRRIGFEIEPKSKRSLVRLIDKVIGNVRSGMPGIC